MHKNSYPKTVLIGNWYEDRAVSESGTPPKAQFNAVSTTKHSYQPRTVSESLSEKAYVATDVERPLLFGHGHDLSSQTFSTMYDITLGAKIPPQLAETTGQSHSLMRSTVKSSTREASEGSASRFTTTYRTSHAAIEPVAVERVASRKVFTSTMDSNHRQIGLRQPEPLRFSPFAR